MEVANIILALLGLIVAVTLPATIAVIGFSLKTQGQLAEHRGKFELLNERINHIRVAINDLNADLIKLEVRIDKEAENAARILHKNNPQTQWQIRMDELLDKLLARQLTTMELSELVIMLDGIMVNEEESEGRRLAAGKVLGYLEARYVHADLIR